MRRRVLRCGKRARRPGFRIAGGAAAARIRLPESKSWRGFQDFSPAPQ
jgi:hypothetical protein